MKIENDLAILPSHDIRHVLYSADLMSAICIPHY